ncbi:MAG: hypothetical protein A2Y33_03270 [Spirochaetes bacterium GWF1_51_8]|nr:MAG: hypothetical protein A2Y33_03270 [Spirochaetes bacterium GWF1_51_8]
MKTIPAISAIDTGKLTIRRDEYLSPAGLSFLGLSPDGTVNIPVNIFRIDFDGMTVYIDSGLDSRRYPMGPSREMRYFPIAYSARGEFARRSSKTAVLFTHLHSDHCGNLKQISPDMLIAYESEIEKAMRPLSRRDGYRKGLFNSMTLTPLREEDFHRAELPFPSAQIPGVPGVTALLTPGHTAGCVSYLVDLDEHRLLFAGDICEGYAGLFYPPYHTADIPDAYIETIVILRAWLDHDPSLVILPSHEAIDAHSFDELLELQRAVFAGMESGH